MTAQPSPREFTKAPYELMSAALLALQSTLSRGKDKKENPDWTTIYTHCESRLASLRNWRWSWWVHWRWLAEFFLPRRYQWLITPNRMWRGSPLNDQIIDSSGLLAVRTCAAGMWTGLTSPSRKWFKLEIGLPWVTLDAEGKEWLEDTTQRVETVLSGSNFYTQTAQMFQDQVVFGTSPMIVNEDFDDIVRFYVPCAGEYYLASSARFTVDTIIREYALTVVQIVDMFRIENCPPQVVQLYQTGGSGLDTEFVVCQMIAPNMPLNRRGAKGECRIAPEAFPYAEVYWLKGVKTNGPLSTKGFNEKPFATFRWALTSNEPYGRSPCMDGLGDNRQVQRETLRKAEFIEKGVRPPMVADVSMKTEPASINPSQITYTSTGEGKKGFSPAFEVDKGWLPALIEDIKSVTARIEQCLFVNLFMAITRMEGVQPRNELELTKRDLERLQELGPVIDLNEKELDVIIRRVLAVLERRRLLKPMPASLMKVPLKIGYTSILRLAQRATESVGMKDVFQTAGALSSAAKAAGVPDPIRTMNLDDALKHYGDLANFPDRLFFTKDQVAEHDAAREKAMQQAHAPGEAMAGVQAAKTLAQTPMGTDSALSRMLGQQPQGAGQ